jgi:hypothetical protein
MKILCVDDEPLALKMLEMSVKKAMQDAEDAVVRSYNALAVNPDVLDCDYYRFKELDAGAVNSYQNEYMSQYYWADFLFDNYLDD